jgi:hypothetical protein
MTDTTTVVRPTTIVSVWVSTSVKDRVRSQPPPFLLRYLLKTETIRNTITSTRVDSVTETQTRTYLSTETATATVTTTNVRNVKETGLSRCLQEVHSLSLNRPVSHTHSQFSARNQSVCTQAHTLPPRPPAAVMRPAVKAPAAAREATSRAILEGGSNCVLSCSYELIVTTSLFMVSALVLIVTHTTKTYPIDFYIFTGTGYVFRA